ncbi:MAG: MFS transporter [Actinobacteria bacterium]|nr:MFS transporter [Actinomycetota bacterium]
MTSAATSRPKGPILLALVMVAVNLRIALSSVPTVVTDIQAATGWSDAAIGMLTTIPVLCMGAFALAVPHIAHAVGRQRTVALALVLLAVALASRAMAAQAPGVLFVSAFVAGTGIALAAGLVPGVVREQLPDALGPATGLWTAAMMVGAALGGALTVPLANWLGSWPAALALWSVPAVLGLVVWTLVERRQRALPANRDVRRRVRLRELPWRDRRAWSLTAYLSINSVVFYTTLAWLAPTYVERGWSQETAGWYFGVFTASQVVAALLLPAIAERVPARRTLYAALVLVAVACVVLIGWAPDSGTVAVVSVFGAALGGSFAMGLALLSEFAGDAHGSARLTAMAFFGTYLLAAVGPFTAGVLMDTFDSWQLVYTLLAVVLLAQLVTIPALRRGVHVR